MNWKLFSFRQPQSVIQESLLDNAAAHEIVEPYFLVHICQSLAEPRNPSSSKTADFYVIRSRDLCHTLIKTKLIHKWTFWRCIEEKTTTHLSQNCAVVSLHLMTLHFITQAEVKQRFDRRISLHLIYNIADYSFWPKEHSNTDSALHMLVVNTLPQI